MVSDFDETPGASHAAGTRAGVLHRFSPVSVQLASVLRRRAWVVVPSLLGCYAWALVPRLKPQPPPQYLATAKLLIREEPVHTGDDRPFLLKTFTKDLSYLEAQCAVLRSRELAKRVVERLDLGLRARFDGGDQEGLLRRFASGLAVRPMRVSAGPASYDVRVIDVSFTAPVPALAAEVANAVCDAFTERENEVNIAEVERALAYLRGKQDDVAEELTAAEEAVRRYETETRSDEAGNRAGAHPPESLARLSGLRKQIEAKRQFLESLVSRAAEIPMSLCAAEARSRLVSRAVVPAAPLPARPRRSLGDGLAMGVIVALALVVAFELLDHTVRDVSGVYQYLEIPVLGTVERAKGDRQSDNGRPMLADPGSGVAESFRRMRANLLFPVREVDWRSLAVVSTLPGEGRSTVLANLAVMIAQSGKRALLVDSDLRRPAHHVAFALDGRVGLVDLLRGEAKPEEVVLGTATANLFVLPCGACPANPSELLSSDAMSDIAKWAVDSYDVVLYDTPSLSVVSDGLVVASLSDAVLFVVQEGQTGWFQARQCLEELRRTGAPVVGAVLNARPATLGRVVLSSMGLASWFPRRGYPRS